MGSLTYLIIIGFFGAIYAICRYGEKMGIKKVNEEQIGVGTWVKIIKPVKYSSISRDKNDKLPSEIEGIVIYKTDKYAYSNIINKHNRASIAIWVASPWSKDWHNQRITGIDEFDKIRIIPESRISEERKEKTLKAIEENKKEFESFLQSIKGRRKLP